jgi:hypothetical protein
MAAVRTLLLYPSPPGIFMCWEPSIRLFRDLRCHPIPHSYSWALDWYVIIIMPIDKPIDDKKNSIIAHG